MENNLPISSDKIAFWELQTSQIKQIDIFKKKTLILQCPDVEYICIKGKKQIKTEVEAQYKKGLKIIF